MPARSSSVCAVARWIASSVRSSAGRSRTAAASTASSILTRATRARTRAARRRTGAEAPILLTARRTSTRASALETRSGHPPRKDRRAAVSASVATSFTSAEESRYSSRRSEPLATLLLQCAADRLPAQLRRRAQFQEVAFGGRGAAGGFQALHRGGRGLEGGADGNRPPPRGHLERLSRSCAPQIDAEVLAHGAHANTTPARHVHMVAHRAVRSDSSGWRRECALLCRHLSSVSQSTRPFSA